MGRKQSSGAVAVWQERLARFERGNLTVSKFCRREGVSTASFYQWRKRLEQRDREPGRVEQAGRGAAGADMPGRFLPVNVAGLNVVEIELPDHIKIRVPATNAEVLRTAILTGHEACREVAPC